MRREERDRKNREIVKQARAKQQRMKTAHAVKMNLLAKQKDVPKATLERALQPASAAAGRIDPEEALAGETGKPEPRKKSNFEVPTLAWGEY